jgi:hypothetical protein
MAFNGPSNSSIHRRALMATGGRVHVSQRLAIDWIRLTDGGMMFQNDGRRNASYPGYRAEILAVADGVVTAVKDGVPENTPGPTSRAVPITLENIAGNHVIQDLGNGRYAVYAHIHPGSVRVKQGDKLRRGQVLGLVGNTGNSTAPHLHFQICDAGSVLGSEGVPYVFDEFELQGRGFGWKPSVEARPNERRMEIPLQNMIVRFPD